jgi:hypothetical protein
MFVRFAQEGLERFELLYGMQFCDVRHVVSIRRDLDEQLVLCFSREMDCEPESIRHDDGIRKNAIAPEQHISFARDELHGSERLRELLQRCIEIDDLRWSVAQDVGTVAGAAAVALILPREAAIALRTSPRNRHGGSTVLVKQPLPPHCNASFFSPRCASRDRG